MPLSPQRRHQLELETALRRKEALRCYVPMPHVMPFHLSRKKERVVKGGKRSGKTVAVTMEFASQVTGIPIHDVNGNELPPKWAISTPESPRRYWVIGYDSRHIGETLYGKLFLPGLFKIIFDPVLNKWRPFNDADPADLARSKEAELAGPAIPDWMIDHKTWVWENKAENYFKSVKLINGAAIHAYISTTPHSKQGDSVDGIWIDEDIQRASHLREYQDRLTVGDGFFLWSAWPHGENAALVGLLQRATEEEANYAEAVKLKAPDQPDPTPPKIEVFKLKMTDNTFISDEGKENSLARMGSTEQQLRRNEGELLRDQLMVYDFMPSLHLLQAKDPKDIPPDCRELKEILSGIVFKNAWSLPHDWTRYLSIDPSHARTAIHIGTVPPEDWEGVRFGRMVIIERELVMRRALAKDIALAVKDMIGTWRIEAMIMDQNYGRQTQAGREDNTAEFFAKEFQAAQIYAHIGGTGLFLPGCNEPSRRRTEVRKFMRVNAYGVPGFFMLDAKTELTKKEFGTYVKKTIDDEEGEPQALDEPANPRIHDCMASIEYLLAYIAERYELGTAHVLPEEYVAQGSAAYQFFQKHVQPSQGKPYTHLGPGNAA